jgi:hypothetical protein
MTTATEAQEAKARIWEALDNGSNLPTEGESQPATDISNVTPVATEAPAETADAAPSDETPAADDPYAGLPESVKHELAGLKTMLAKANDRLRNTEGHIGGLKTQLQQLAAQAKPAAADGPTAAELKAAQGSNEAMAKLLDDYPDLGASFKGALEEAVRPLQEQLKSLTGKEPVQGVTSSDLTKLRAELTVEARHPGWQERVRTAQFQGWLQSQPREVQLLAASDSPQDAIRLLDLEVEAGKSAGQQRTQRLNSAAAMPTGRASAQRAKPVESMTKEEYWAYLDNLESQKA